MILDAAGNHVGYMAEQERGMGSMMARQWFRTHRSFVTHVFDRHENEVLRVSFLRPMLLHIWLISQFHRPFSWINSRIRVYDPFNAGTSSHSSSSALQPNTPGSLAQASDYPNARVSPLAIDEMRVIGEAQQQWAPLRRKYNLFTYHHSPNIATEMGTQRIPLTETGLSNSQQMQLSQTPEGNRDFGEFNQFAYVDEPFLSWDFSLRSADNRLIGSVNRDFVGFAREIFTDTGVYALRMDSAALKPAEAPGQGTSITGMTLDQRAVMLATAVSVDFDYFSRHSGAGGMGFFPMWIPGVGGDAAAGGAATGEAGAVGEAAAGTVGRGAAGSMGEGAAAGVAGAGAMAGYDAMSRGTTGESRPQGGAPTQPPVDQNSPTGSQTGPYGDVWAPEQKSDRQSDNPWADEYDDDDGGDGGGGGGGGDDYDFF